MSKITEFTRIVFVTVAIVAILAGLAACTRFEDGYQFGDVTLTAVDAYKRAATVQGWYCAAASPEQRESAKAIFEGMGIDLHEVDVCGISVAMIIDQARRAPGEE